jgi:hypothetical protein
MGQRDIEKNISPNMDPQDAELNTTDENYLVVPVSSTALTILSLSFTVANFMIALDSSILGAWAA